MEYRIINLDRWKDATMSRWEEFYGWADYKGKVVLDVGADWGRTADYFLQKGASKVVAVEHNETYYNRLEKNSELIEGIVPLLMTVTVANLIQLIQKYEPDLVEINFQGGASLLVNLPDWVFNIIPEYIVMINAEWGEKLRRKCEKNNYQVEEHRPKPPHPSIRIFHLSP